MKPDLNPEMQSFIDRVSMKNMYSGAKMPDSIMKQWTIEETEYTIGVLVPFWIAALQYGRGPRKSTKYGGFDKALYKWMQKNNLFRSQTAEGRINESKSMAWYINKYGNQHFRNKTFVDIYKTERERAVKEIDAKMGGYINKITMDIL